MTINLQRRKILVLSANPKGTSKLRLEEECREIKQGLRRAKHRDLYSIETAEAVRYRDIHRALLDYEPNIVHFSGHGSGEEGLAFEDETGQIKLVNANALADLFALFSDHVECIVLNACYSEVQARAIAQHISYVIGMSQTIGDEAAIEFAVGFYDGLGAGKPVEFAYKLSCVLISMAGIPENLTPQLLIRVPDVSLPDLLEPVESNKPSDTVELKQKVELRSEEGIDYTHLRDLLAVGKWKEADDETSLVILRTIGRRKRVVPLSGVFESGFIEPWFSRGGAFAEFPCEDLRTIDQLWVKHSNSHFGFSVQKQIYQSLCDAGQNDFLKNWGAFSDRVGWGVGGSLTFDITAPAGHMPSEGFRRGARAMGVLLFRVENCKL